MEDFFFFFDFCETLRGSVRDELERFKIQGWLVGWVGGGVCGGSPQVWQSAVRLQDLHCLCAVRPSCACMKKSAAIKRSHARGGRGSAAAGAAARPPADLFVRHRRCRCCHLLWELPLLFKSKLKTLSFDVQIYRSLFLSLAL